METNNNQENKKANRIFRQTSFAKTMAIMSVITFVVTFIVYLLLDNNIGDISNVYILHILKKTVIFSAIFLFVFFYLWKYLYYKVHSKNVSNDGNTEAVKQENSVSRHTSFTKRSLLQIVVLFVIFFVALLFRKDNIAALSATDILKTLVISAIGTVVSYFLFWYFPSKAQYNLSKGQTESDFFKSKECVISTIIAGTFLTFLFSALIIFGMYGLAVHGRVAELTEEASNQILYSKIPYGVILFVAGEFLLYLYLRHMKRKYKDK